MATGSPDWFGTIRPAYGQTAKIFIEKEVPSDEETQLHSITGRGIVLGGYTKWSGDATRKDLDTGIFIDDVNICNMSPNALRIDQVFKGNINPLFLIIYDDDNHSYIVGITWGLTFETSYKVKVRHGYVGDQTVYARLHWALVP